MGIFQTIIGFINGSGTAQGAITIPVDNIGTTSTDGLTLTNTTPAAVGAQQESPRIHFHGSGWKTDATAGPQDVDVINELLPVQGAAAPTANLLWKYAVNGGAYTTIATLDSSGNFTVVNALIAAGTVVFDGSSGLVSTTRGGLRWTGDGQVSVLTTAQTAGVGLDVVTDAVLKVRTRAQSAYATVDALAFRYGGVTAISSTGVVAPGGLTVAGALGVPAVVAVGRVTAQSAANAAISTFTVGAADASFEVSANMNVTASTTLVTTLTCTYTDEASAARSMIFPVASLAGSFIAAGAITGAGASVWETPVMHIRAKATTVITILTSAGTFTGVTYTAEGVIKQTK